MQDLSSFKTWLSINVGRKSTDNYINQMKGFFLHYPEFNQENLNNYLASKLNLWGSGSFNCFYKAVRKYMLFTKVTLELPKSKREERKPRTYTKAVDIEEMLSKCPIIFRDYQKAQTVLELLFLSGMRPKELLTLKRENINLIERKISLINTKTATSRVVFLTDKLAKNIFKIFQREVEDKNAFNLNESSIEYYCSTISKYCNIKINPYQLRHGFAHNFLKKSGNNLIALSKILGHIHLDTTQIYCDVNEKELQEIYNKTLNKKRRK